MWLISCFSHDLVSVYLWMEGETRHLSEVITLYGAVEMPSSSPFGRVEVEHHCNYW